MKNESLTLNDVAEFSWNYSSEFLLETEKGNFIWSDPDYQGDNTIRPFPGNNTDFCKAYDIPYSRDKGKHIIQDYCGKDVKIIS
jgi:hypothetical protein